MKANIMQQNQNFNRVQYKCVLNLGSQTNKIKTTIILQAK